MQAEAEVGAVPVVAAATNHSGSPLRKRLRPSQGGEADGMRRRPGPLSYEFRTLLLDVEAALDQLKQTAWHFADWARELTRMNVAGQNAHAQAWEQMHQTLDEYLRDLRANAGTISVRSRADVPDLQFDAQAERALAGAADWRTSRC